MVDMERNYIENERKDSLGSTNLDDGTIFHQNLVLSLNADEWLKAQHRSFL